MSLVGKHVYQTFKGCSFVPYFDPDPLERVKDQCICENHHHHHLPTHHQPTQSKRPSTSSSSVKRPSRGKSGGNKHKDARIPSIASLLDIGFNEWSPHDDHSSSKKQNGRTSTRGATRRKSDRNAPNIQGECASERPCQRECHPFHFYDDTSRYIAEYRARHVQKLIGYDGSSEPEDLTFGENIPDPYVFKTAPFKRAFEAIQTALIAERKHQDDQKRSRQNNSCPNLSPTGMERHWQPSDSKHLPGLTTQPIFATTVDAVCAGMRHVGQDVFKPPLLPKKRSREISTSSSRRSLVSRQRKPEENGGDKLEMALAQSRLAMRDRLGIKDEIPNASRQSSSSSSSRSPENISTKTTTSYTSTTLSTASTPSTRKSKADWMAISDDQAEATRTMLLFLQKARGDVDRSREKRVRHSLPSHTSGKSATDKQRFTAMLCRDGENEQPPQVTGQLKNGRLVKVFRPSGTGDIKLEEALKAGRLHVSVGLGM